MLTRHILKRNISAALLSLAISLLLASTAHAQDIVISGVIDGPLTGGVPKAIEFYAVNDVVDLSEYGVSSANNGGGTTGAPEFVFPAGAVSAGSYFYLASEAPNFTAFFGFAPTYSDGSAPSINGDDAIELFRGGTVVDVFGEVDVDGSGQPWEYQDGWAYRVNDSGPDGQTFSLASWTFSGPNALDGELTNAAAATPFPLGTFTRTAGDAAPRVIATVPVEGETGVGIGSLVVITFNEPVIVDGTWFELVCSTSGAVGAGVSSADSTTYTLTPNSDFVPGEICAVTVFAARISDIDADDPPNNPSADFTLTFSVGGTGIAGVVINEIHADPAFPDGDANGDGTRDASQDEFLEIVNATGAELDLGNWTISDAVAVRHTFPPGTILQADCAIVVFGGGLPSGEFGGALVQTASNGLLGFNNGGDSIVITDAEGGEAASRSYDGEGGNDESLTRNPDLSGAFVGHSSINGALFSPGTRVDGGTFDGCTPPLLPTPIYDVQGSGNTSPLVDQTVLIEGIVTGDLQDGDADIQNSIRGFFVQEETADSDGDPDTSDGIFVFESSTIVDVTVGDLVAVRGRVTEFFGETQVSADSVEVVSSGNTVPAPSEVILPAADVVAIGDEYIPDLERYEGMLVTFPDTLYVTDLFNLDRFGEIQLITGGVPFQFTNFSEPDAGGLDAHLRDIGSRTIMLDDGLTLQNPDPIRYPPPGLPNGIGAIVRSGDTVTGLTGNIRYSRGSGGSGDDFYRLMPTMEPVFVARNLRPPTPPDVGGSLKVASFNVLNFFTTIDRPTSSCGPLLLGCRGADSSAEFERQLAKIVAAITELDADIVGLIELENSDGTTLPVLVDALNAATGAGTYDYVDTGFIGEDAIKVGFIYQPAAAMPTGTFAVLDSTVDPRFIDTKNRPVLAQTFSEIATGGIVTVAVNHLKSKGSACDDVGDPNLGDGQGNCNLTRTNAALATLDWLATDPTRSGDADFMVIGDLNAYLQEDPLAAYRNAGYTNLLEQFVGSNAYTFIFDQQLGALDHALANPTLAPQVTGTAIWHINIEEADALDYNLDFGRNPDIFEPDLFRSSDHEPVIVGLALVADRDNDGVPDADDQCPGTSIPEAVPSANLKPNRFALTDGDAVFDSDKSGSKFIYTVAETAGCSCEQIISETGSGAGHTKFGCSNGLMKEWVGSVNRSN